MKHLTSLLAALCLSASLLCAQDNVGIPADVFYLMPEMTQGTLVFRDKAPVSGQFNICAIDGSVRFKDRNGTELQVVDDGSLWKVSFDGVTFLRESDGFYRLYPVSDEISVAVLREVVLMNDSNAASYGMESHTTAVQTIGFMQDEGRVLNLEEVKDIPYRMSETAFLLRGESILRLTKKNCIKCFPDKKADIEAWFAAHKKMGASDIEAVLSLCKEWGK